MFVIQAGHQNIESNCNAALRGETGATHAGDPNAEREITQAVAIAVVNLLMDAGVTAMSVDANFNCSPSVGEVYEGAIALHCQSNPPAESGFDVGVGDPTKDGAAAQSAKLMENIAAQYEAATGLTRQTWCQNNPNVQEYYLFNALALQTPFALVELCNADLDNEWAHEHLNRMAYGIANAVLAFLGNPTLTIPDLPNPPLGSEPPPQSGASADLRAAIAAFNGAVQTLNDAIDKVLTEIG